MLPGLTRLSLFALPAFFATSLSGCALFREPVPDRLPVYAAHATEGDLLAGAAAVDITPVRNLYMGGFAVMRESKGVHDPLYARALVLRRGEMEVALVALDLVGLMRPQVIEIQQALSGLEARHTLVASTHNHHSPDTMGLWGFPLLASGSDPKYMAQVRAGAVLAIERARSALRPAELGSGVVTFDPKGLIKNSSRPGLVDPETVVLHVRAAGGGETIATLVELGCHPEAVKRTNRLITADFPGWTVSTLEAELGGVAIYVSGALGALVSPDRISNGSVDPARWDESERIGRRLAEHALEAVRSIPRYDAVPQLAVWHSRVYLENENWRYDLLRFTGVVDRELFGSGYLESEVNLWRIGELAVASVPGEISPDFGLRIKRVTGAERTMIVGLANDELGYLLAPWDYEMEYYDYERGLCVGRDAAATIFARLEDLALLALYSKR
jgi:hypothetical protein